MSDTPTPSVDAVRTVLVVGAGAMGTQIGAVFALAGYDVITSDVTEEALARSRAEAESRLGRMAEKGQKTPEGTSPMLCTVSTRSGARSPACQVTSPVRSASANRSRSRGRYSAKA